MTQAIQKTLRDSAGMRWTALLLLALAMFCSYIFMDILSPIKDLPHLCRYHPRQDGRSFHRCAFSSCNAGRCLRKMVRRKRKLYGNRTRDLV